MKTYTKVLAILVLTALVFTINLSVTKACPPSMPPNVIECPPFDNELSLREKLKYNAPLVLLAGVGVIGAIALVTKRIKK